MKQIVQNIKSGKIETIEVPYPSLSEKFVLVENSFSLISIGTEKSTVDFGKSSLINKAISRPDLVQQVLNNFRKEGFSSTLKKVSTRLESLTALGYSCSGVVKSSLDTNSEFQPGDKVACAGQGYASHSDFVSVPQNLCVKVPKNVSMEEASFTTLGAIALQGVRQANPAIGENICVIGLGLLGQLSVQILKANGCNVVGVDVDKETVDLVNKNYAKAFNRSEDNLINKLSNFTKGKGFDKVIITAKASTNDPIIISTKILRKKGEIILVGDVPIEIPREPDFYKNELGFKISCSYGPGRYDRDYEEYGNDYPLAYVRWTEKRNMEGFLDLVNSGTVNLKPMITHIFSVNDAMKAYDLVLGSKKESFTGVLISYDTRKSNKTIINSQKIHPIKDINIGFLGAGNYAQSYLIPAAKNFGSLETVVTQNGTSGLSVAKKFGFNASSTCSDDIFKNKFINTVFIATRHDSHANYLIQSLKNNKSVFLEKPLALNMEEFIKIKKAVNSQTPHFTVGYNRRFSKLSEKLKSSFGEIDEPLIINYRINAGLISKDSWIQKDEGGGRIIGEICHFIDLMQFITNSSPDEVYAKHISNFNLNDKMDDNISIIIKFNDGSIGNIIYCANGNSKMPKERIEVFGGSKSAVLNDFKSLEIFNENQREKIKLNDKGQYLCVKAFCNSLEGNHENLIDLNSLFLTSLTTFKIIDSIKTGLPQKISL